MDVVMALFFCGKAGPRVFVVPTTVHRSHSVQTGLHSPTLWTAKTSLLRVLAVHFAFVRHHVGDGLAKVRIRSGVLINKFYRKERISAVLDHFLEHSIHTIVLEEWGLVFVAKDPQPDENRPLRVGGGCRNLVLRKTLRIDPDLERLKDSSLGIR